MKRLFTWMLFSALMLTAQAQLFNRKAVERYTPGTVTFKDGHQTTYRWVQLPFSGLTEIMVANDEKHKKKETIPATEIENITVWTEKYPDSLLTLYYVHADKSKIPLAGMGMIGISLKDNWGQPIASSAWGTVYRCPGYYAIDKKTGKIYEEYLQHYSNMGNGMMQVSSIPAMCFLKCRKYENAQLIGTSIPAVRSLLFTYFSKKIAPFFDENPTIAKAVEDKSLNGGDIQYILDEMAAFCGLTAPDEKVPLAEADVVVYPEYTEAEISMMFDYSTWFNRFNMKKDSHTLSEYARIGYHGTAVLAKNDAVYAVTDRNVVGYARTATVECWVDGGTRRFEHCRVLGAETDRGVTYVLLPDEADSLVIPVDSQLVVNKKQLKKDYHDLARCADINGKSWVKLLAQFPKQRIQRMLHSPHTMPLDVVLETMTAGKAQLTKEKSGKTRVKSRLGLVSDVRFWGLGLYYDNFISPVNMSQGLEVDWNVGPGRIAVVGAQIGCLIEDAYRVKELPGSKTVREPMAAFQFGIYGGAQAPLRVADRHLLLPRVTLGLNFGPFFDGYDYARKAHTLSSFILATDTRAGLDYRYEMDKVDLYFGVRYTFHFYATDAHMVAPVVNNTGLDLLPYIEHGVSAHAGVYF